MRRAVVLPFVVSLLFASICWGAQPESQVAVRRVLISLSFSGNRVFLFGRMPAGADDLLAVMEGPSPGPIRLMEKGRVGPFWLGVHQYSLTRAPGYYWVDLHCAACNGLLHCEHGADLDRLNRALASHGVAVGPSAVRSRARIERLSGTLAQVEAVRVLDGFWGLESRRGLYGIRENAIRVSADRAFYHVFVLPTQAPEGKYHITTYFLAGDRLVGTAENDLFVSKSGLVGWLSRLAKRSGLTYGLFTIAIAIGAGWLAGTLFRRGGGH
jgi:Putative transmembrane protein (Alph_Pro_TM)